MKSFFILLLSFLAGTVSSCQKNNFTSDSQETINLVEKSAQLIEADNAFGLELFQQIRSKSSEENLLVSPFSISVALAMAYNGADAETRAEMEITMKLNGLTKEQINESYRKLIKDLQSLDEKVVFEIANAIFYSNEFSVKSGFLSLNRTVYDAEVVSLDFNAPSAVEAINSWVKEKTNGKIQEIIRQLSPLDKMVLLNAIYFYGTWTKVFNEFGTRNHQFTKTDGSTLEIPMMNKLDKLPFGSIDEFKAIKVPYGNGQYQMVVILPEEEYNSQDIINKLSVANWNAWMLEFELTDRVDVTMPRFKFAFETSLNDVLSSMGMQEAFIPEKADFSGITDEELFISEARHKTFIDVNETGTEAAAVTSVVFATSSMTEEQPVVPFFVNKPFIFAITEKDSGAVLFIGEVNHPEYN
jgi:serine protease inhibitor